MKKKTFKVYKERFKAILAFSIAGAYGFTGLNCGFNNLNKTLIRDGESLIYNKSKLVDHINEDALTNSDYNKLDKICFLKLDMAKEQDLYYLRYFSNLKYLEIYNAEYLTDLAIEEINKSSAEEINLYFDRTYAIKNIRNKFDISRFSDKSKIKSIKFTDDTNNQEIDSIIFLEYLCNYEGFNLDINKYENLDKELDKIIEELNLDENTYNNIDNLLKITDYVLSKIQYDKKIKNYNANHKRMYSMTPIYRKTINYNEKSLSSILKEKEEVNGICTNYADLILALSLKGNVCVNTVKGELNDEGHSWNVAMFKDCDFYFDSTWLDRNDEFSILLNKYLETHSDEDFNNILNYFVIDINSEKGKKYIPDKSIEYYTKEETKEFNCNYIYGTNIPKRIILLNALYGFLSYELLCVLVIISELLKRKICSKKDDKEKILTK